MPKKIVLLDDDGASARLRYEALVTERYDVHLVTQHMPSFDTLVQMQPDFLLLHWSKFSLVEAEILTLAATDDLRRCDLFLLGPALDQDEWDEWDDKSNVRFPEWRFPSTLWHGRRAAPAWWNVLFVGQRAHWNRIAMCSVSNRMTG